jgi:hypothetical protein
MDEEKCAHLVLQMRTQMLDERLEETFRHWYPDFRTKRLKHPLFLLSTLAQSTLGGLFGLFLLVVAKATYLTFPHVPTHSAAGSSASHWSLGFPRPPDRRHHRRISHFSVFPPT